MSFCFVLRQTCKALKIPSKLSALQGLARGDSQLRQRHPAKRAAEIPFAKADA
jgi:hypothetical protein